LQFDPEKLTNILTPIAAEVYVEPQNAVLDISPDGKQVLNFIPSAEGVKVDMEGMIAQINETAFTTPAPTEIPLLIASAVPQIKTEDVNKLGIKELLGEGESNYSGSPSNRRHNIAVGAKAVNGTLIAPGEEFSMIKTLGEIDAKNGYLEELVIKGNKTTPEFGGGLCQIGTTMFRSALRAALPITARRAHSYRVSYYEPAGTDATIYSPNPDLRFKNDTANYVLIRTINDTANSKLYFQVWGTSEQRSVSLTDPVIYDIVSPPPGKLIETLDLKPGVKKCTERAHAGAKAYFTRTVTLADGTTKEERFDSTYRPWQEVCLIGVEKLSDQAAPTEVETTPLSPDGPVIDVPPVIGTGTNTNTNQEVKPNTIP